MDLAHHIAKGEKEKAEIIKTFYDEYFAVMDLPAEFYIETVRDVFQEHLLPQGKLMHRGRPVNCAAIKRMRERVLLLWPAPIDGAACSGAPFPSAR